MITTHVFNINMYKSPLVYVVNESIREAVYTLYRSTCRIDYTSSSTRIWHTTWNGNVHHIISFWNFLIPVSKPICKRKQFSHHFSTMGSNTTLLPTSYYYENDEWHCDTIDKQRSSSRGLPYYEKHVSISMYVFPWGRRDDVSICNESMVSGKEHRCRCSHDPLLRHHPLQIALGRHQ